MGHLPDLIADLALILIAGATTTIVFRKIRQPLVLGYIIAGFLVGPHFDFLPSVHDTNNIEILAEIGVIFLLFSLGLEFSFKKLMRVGGSASITAFVEIFFITVAGYMAGKWMCWSTMDSLFLGGMLASSSTTIIIRAFDELGMKTRQYARVVFGVLVVEDIVVIVLMVLLSTIAVTQQFEGSDIVFTVLKLLFFLALWFLAGIFLLPTMLKKAKSLLDQETLLILALGLCLGMVVLATQVGFSAELGAFVMGSLIAETTSAEKVEHLIKPVKDLFGAVFFVSVGMMIDPVAIAEYAMPVLCITLITLFGKFFSTTLGALISGQPLKQSVQVGMSMAQIGEFAFIVATLGLSLGVTSNFLFPVAVGVSAITTFTTPYMISGSERFYHFLERVLPAPLISRLNAYSTGTQSIQAETDWKIVLRSYRNILMVNGFVLLAMFLFSINFLLPYFTARTDEWNGRIITIMVSLILAAPFLWALMAKKPEHAAYKVLWLETTYNRGPLLIVEVTRMLLGIVLIGLWTFEILPSGTSLLVIMPLSALIMLMFARKMKQFYRKLEVRFLNNLNAREIVAASDISLTARLTRKRNVFQSKLIPWDAHIVQLEAPPNAPYIGKQLKELTWRERYGINVVYIKRGEKVITTPNRDQFIMPFDQVGIIATDHQINIFKPIFDESDIQGGNSQDISNIVFDKIIVNDYSRLYGLSLRNSRLRETTGGLVIGIERRDERILNPDAATVFEKGDIVWLVGDRKRIQSVVTRNTPQQAFTTA